VESAESAIAAERGGATRVELCSSLVEGGVTPSAGLIGLVREKISIGLHVIIRPRGGDFCYMSEEFDVMHRDVLVAKELSVDGIVFGILDTDGKVDVARTRQLVDLAGPLKVTYHRAFDMSVNLMRSLEDVVQTGAERILTSGGAENSIAGTRTLRQLVDAAGEQVIIMAGGGINPRNVRTLIDETGVREVHASLKSSMKSPMRHKNEKISMGSLEGREYQRFTILEDQVRQLVRAASASGASG
jgi:copper homeostasis protein